MSKDFERTYIYGNAARNIDVKRALEESPTGEPLRVIKGRRKQELKRHMGFIYVFFLAVCVTVTGYALFGYLRYQSEISVLSDRISAHEAELNNLTLANDDEYSKMINAIDYDQVRTKAIEMGMVYPSEDQIITYTRENSDYVRQTNNLSD